MKMYYIALVLPEDLNEIILKQKRMMQERFQAIVGLKSPAHITIIPPFWMDAEREDELKQDVEQVAGSVKTFLVETKDFSCFKPRTIFVDVQKSDALKALKQKGEDHFTRGNYKIKREERPFQPHITIATRDLQKHHFQEAWTLFEKKKFQKQFTADALSLLRHNGKNWDVIHRASFSFKHEDAGD